MQERSVSIEIPGGSLDPRQLSCEVDRASRNKRPLALIAARVEEGSEEELDAVCQLMFAQCRAYDGRGRMEDGTVLVLLPEVDLKYGITVAERMSWRARREAPELAPRLRFFVTTLAQIPDCTWQSFVRTARDGVELSRRPVEHNQDGLLSWRVRSA